MFVCYHLHCCCDLFLPHATYEFALDCNSCNELSWDFMISWRLYLRTISLHACFDGVSSKQLIYTIFGTIEFICYRLSYLQRVKLRSHDFFASLPNQWIFRVKLRFHDFLASLPSNHIFSCLLRWSKLLATELHNICYSRVHLLSIVISATS